jgi:hypothetical protein
MSKLKRIVLVILLACFTIYGPCGGPPPAPSPPPPGGFYVYTTINGINNPAPVAETYTLIEGVWSSDAPGAVGSVLSFPFTSTGASATLYVTGGRAPAMWVFAEDSGWCSGESTVPTLVQLNETTTVNCFVDELPLTGFAISPEYIDTYFVPATWEVTGAGISSQYGMPILQYVDSNGTVMAQTAATSVASDGSSMSGPTPDLSGVADGLYPGLISNAGPGGTWTVIGAVAETIDTTPPAPLNGSSGLGNGQTLEWNYYVSSSGNCGPYGGTYTLWSFDYFTYVDASGYPYPISNGGASYIYGSQSQYCPPTGPQPAVLPLGYTGADGHMMIDFYPGYGGSGSAVITQQ